MKLVKSTFSPGQDYMKHVGPVSFIEQLHHRTLVFLGLQNILFPFIPACAETKSVGQIHGHVVSDKPNAFIRTTSERLRR